MLRIVLADDHQVVREGLRRLLEAALHCSIVGEASNGQEAIALTQRLRPDVLVVDLMMPEVGGLQVIRRVRAEVSDTRIVVLSMHANEAHVREALREGATAYVLKEALADEFIQAIQEAAAGRRYLSRPLSERAIQAYVDRIGDATLDPYEALTEREREVLYLAAQGRSNAVIAEQLVISPRTVETYRAAVLRKLELGSQTDLVLYALKRGLIVLPDS